MDENYEYKNMTDKEFMEKRKEIISFINSVANPGNWWLGRCEKGWFAKRNIVQWAEDILSNTPIKRSGPVED